MQKIASPQELQAELRRLLAYCSGSEKPSREKLANELNILADRMAAEDVPRSDTALVLKLDKLGKDIAEAATDVKLKAVPRHKASGEFDKAVKRLRAAYKELGDALKDL